MPCTMLGTSLANATKRNHEKEKVKSFYPSDLHDLATTAESIKFAANAADSMALLAIGHENRPGNLDLLKEPGYFDAMQRLTSYVCRDMQELEDEACRLAREL